MNLDVPYEKLGTKTTINYIPLKLAFDDVEQHQPPKENRQHHQRETAARNNAGSSQQQQRAFQFDTAAAAAAAAAAGINSENTNNYNKNATAHNMFYDNGESGGSDSDSALSNNGLFIALLSIVCVLVVLYVVYMVYVYIILRERQTSPSLDDQQNFF
nr:AC78 [Calliteara abietis nucleopolyhedrovirus]